ncbi:SPASM domain-containing protein [Streptosporangium nondiastaticum]|uniref:SPASM domain-containing protein n=1 Tax=Streptosporangium nondiastaticum TaxID=35764 RepID=UPI003F4AD2F0
MSRTAKPWSPLWGVGLAGLHPYVLGPHGGVSAPSGRMPHDWPGAVFPGRALTFFSAHPPGAAMTRRSEKGTPRCIAPFLSLATWADGETVICCEDKGPAAGRLGHVGDVSELVNSEKMRSARKQLMRGEVPAGCRACLGEAAHQPTVHDYTRRASAGSRSPCTTASTSPEASRARPPDTSGRSGTGTRSPVTPR